MYLPRGPIHLHNLAETAALYERIAKNMAIDALMIGGLPQTCEECPVPTPCADEWDCETKIADVLWEKWEVKTR
jgi:hypothetical protein